MSIQNNSNTQTPEADLASDGATISLINAAKEDNNVKGKAGPEDLKDNKLDAKKENNSIRKFPKFPSFPKQPRTSNDMRDFLYLIFPKSANE